MPRLRGARSISSSTAITCGVARHARGSDAGMARAGQRWRACVSAAAACCVKRCVCDDLRTARVAASKLHGLSAVAAFRQVTRHEQARTQRWRACIANARPRTHTRPSAQPHLACCQVVERVLHEVAQVVADVAVAGASEVVVVGVLRQPPDGRAEGGMDAMRRRDATQRGRRSRRHAHGKARVSTRRNAVRCGSVAGGCWHSEREAPRRAGAQCGALLLCVLRIAATSQACFTCRSRST